MHACRPRVEYSAGGANREMIVAFEGAERRIGWTSVLSVGMVTDIMRYRDGQSFRARGIMSEGRQCQYRNVANRRGRLRRTLVMYDEGGENSESSHSHHR